MGVTFPTRKLRAMALAVALLSCSAWAQGNFLYTNDDVQLNTVSAFAMAPDGTHTVVKGSPFSTGGTGLGFFIGDNPSARIVVDGEKHLLFAANTVSVNVSVFNIHGKTGALTPIAGSPFATGVAGGPVDGTSVSGGYVDGLAETPDGRFLMAANGIFSISSGVGSITVFRIGPNGSLEPVAGSPFTTVSTTPQGIKVSPDGRFVAVGGGDVEMFRIADDGALHSLGVFPAEGSGTLGGTEIDCSSTHLYSGQTGVPAAEVAAYDIAPHGYLTPARNAPFETAGLNALGLQLSPDGRTLYVSENSSILVLRVGLGGRLTQVQNVRTSEPTFVDGMSISRDGRLLYLAASEPARVFVFQVARNGTLTEVTGPAFYTGQGTGLTSLAAYPPKTCGLR